MDPFPLLTLPSEALQKLLNRFEIGELFHLAQCSRKALNVVKTFALSLQRARFSINFTRVTNPRIHLHYSGSVIRFNFYGERDPKRLNLRFPKTYNIDGQLIDFCEEGTGPRPRYGCATPHSPADVIKLLRYLKTVFNAKLRFVDLPTNDGYLGTMTDWLETTPSTMIGVWDGRVTHEEMTQVLERCDGVGSLQLFCTPGPYFSYDKTISTGFLWMDNATWIRRHNLLKFDCEHVNIYGSHLKNEDLNVFLSHWLQSGDKKLKYMIISRNRCSSEEEETNTERFVQEEILKELQTIPGAQKRRDAISPIHYMHTPIPFEAGRDLRRESDGVLATVVVREERHHGVTFTFVVWQVPNPNVVVVVP